MSRLSIALATLIAAATPAAAPAVDASADTAAWNTPAPAPQHTCGNGLVEAGESCEACPADCQVHPCAPSDEKTKRTVKIVPAPGATPVSVAVRVAYKSDRLQLPGAGVEGGPRDRVSSLVATTQVVANDMDHSLRVVMTDANGLAGGGFQVAFDRCSGAPAPTADDVICWVEHCSGSGGAITGCGCTADPAD